MTTSVAGTGIKIVMDEFDLSSYIKDKGLNRGRDQEDITTLGNNAHRFGKTLKLGDLSFNGVWSGTPNGLLEDALSAGGSQIFSVFQEGFGAVGKLASLFQSQASSYGITGNVANVSSFAFATVADGGIEDGVVLQPAVAITAEGESTPHISAAASANGGVAHLHVLAFNGTDLDIALEHSPDGGVWAELGTFAQVTGLTKERLVIAEGVDVDEQLRLAFTGTFTSALIVVSFARR